MENKIHYTELIEFILNGKLALKTPNNDNSMAVFETNCNYISYSKQMSIVESLENSCIIQEKNSYHVNHVLKNMMMILLVFDNFTNVYGLDELLEKGNYEEIEKFCEIIKFNSNGLYERVISDISNFREVIDLANLTIQDKLNRLNSVENIVAEKISELFDMIKNIDNKKIDKFAKTVFKHINKNDILKSLINNKEMMMKDDNN